MLLPSNQPINQSTNQVTVAAASPTSPSFTKIGTRRPFSVVCLIVVVCLLVCVFVVAVVVTVVGCCWLLLLL